jgi:periplasmic protein TonB
MASIGGSCSVANVVPNLTLKVNGADQPVYYVGCDVKPPEILSEPKLQAGGPQGSVVVIMIATSKADIADIKVAVKGTDSTQDTRAIEAARRYKFKPATKNGEPVSVRIAIKIDFHS